MKILQLVPSLDTGGAERSAIEIAEALTHAGHQNWIAAKPGAWSMWASNAGAQLLAIPVGSKSLRLISAFFQLRRAIVQIKPDIVHTRSRLPSWLFWCVQKTLPAQTRPRWVSTLHGLHSVSRYSAIQHSGELAITVSETAKQYVSEHYSKAHAERLVVIPRGADTSKFGPDKNTREWKEAFYQEFPQLQGKAFLLLAGRGTRLKGHADAIKLVHALRASNPSIRLFFAGIIEPTRSAYVDEMKVLAASLGVQDQIVFVPSRDDLPALYGECAALLQLSVRPESFGRTVCEALLCNAPVIGYDHGGVGEQLRQCFPEGLVRLSDGDMLLQRAEAILQLRPKIDRSNIPTTQQMQQRTLAAYRRLLGLG